MSKECIFNARKICDNCGECEVCELNSNKKCNNCGKCLELEGYDVKAIKIDEVFEAEELEDELEDEFYDKTKIALSQLEENDSEDDIHELLKSEELLKIEEELEKSEELIKIEEYDLLLAEKEHSNLDKDGFTPENNEVWEYIDDIEGVKDILENEEENSELLHEEFPGLITLKKV